MHQGVKNWIATNCYSKQRILPLHVINSFFCISYYKDSNFRSYFQTFNTYDKQAEDSFLSCTGWKRDTAGEFNDCSYWDHSKNVMHDSLNDGYIKRAKMFQFDHEPFEYMTYKLIIGLSTIFYKHFLVNQKGSLQIYIMIWMTAVAPLFQELKFFWFHFEHNKSAIFGDVRGISWVFFYN